MKRTEPTPSVSARLAGARSVLVVPMLKENELIGAISIYRGEVRPFTDKQLALVKNFAAQAVIAIENARLLSELRNRWRSRPRLRRCLTRHRRSPGELQPVFTSMLDNAIGICEAKYGTIICAKATRYRAAARQSHRPRPPS